MSRLLLCLPVLALSLSAWAQESCATLTQRALDGDLQLAQAAQSPLKERLARLDANLLVWRQAVQACEGKARERAERLVADNLRQREQWTAEQGGATCDKGQRDAEALQTLGEQAAAQKRWPEAAGHYRRAELQWELAAEACTGPARERAQGQRALAETAAQQAERGEAAAPPKVELAMDCKSGSDRARLQTRKLLDPAGATRESLLEAAEDAWIAAIQLCDGPDLQRARANAEALARARLAGKLPPRPALQPLAAAGVAPQLNTLPNGDMELRTATARYVGRFKQETDQTLSGTGRVEWVGGDVYTGALQHGKREGQGEFAMASGQKISGEWRADRLDGRGKLVDPAGHVYEGQLSNGLPEGEGEFRYASGDTYKGEFKRGVPNGRGLYRWANGNSFDGPWVEHRALGVGVMRFANGNVYEGPVVDGIPQGKGRMKFASGDEYEGDYKDGVAHGQGKYVWASGDRYEGAWVAGKRQGQGVFFWASGGRWEGRFENDAHTTDGKLITE